MTAAKLTQEGTLQIAGSLDTRLPLVTDGLIAHFPMDGTTKGIANHNLLNYSTWTIGTSGSQTGFNHNGDGNGNSIVEDIGPFGESQSIWQTLNDDVTFGADGGWDTGSFSVDSSKMYRFSVWVNRRVLGSGHFSLGLHGSGSTSGVTSNDSSTWKASAYPYFDHKDWGWSTDEWFLVVGHVHPYDETVYGDHPDSGWYKVGCATKHSELSHCDWRWHSSTTSANHKTYLYYSTDTSTQQLWAYPRVDLCDGTEPSIKDLVNGEGNIINAATSKVRYIRDYLNGSTANSANHWVEIQAINSSGTNVAYGKISDSSLLTEGNTATSRYYEKSPGLTSVTVDLQAIYDISEVKVWHYYGDSRTYHATKTQVSSDGVHWVTLFDSAVQGEYTETSAGRTYLLNQHNSDEYIAIESATKNLYLDGNYATKTIHPVHNGIWDFPDGVVGPDGGQVIRNRPDGTTSYNGRDIPVIDGNSYSSSTWCWVSPDFDGTWVRLMGERAFGPDASYDLSRKGEWQRIKASGVTSGTNARILTYTSGFNKGVVYFSDTQFEASHYATGYVDGGRTQLSLMYDFQNLSEGTIIGKFKPDVQGVYASGSYPYVPNQASIIGIHDTVNGGNMYYRWYAANGSTPFLDPDGSYGTAHIHATVTISTNDLWFTIKRTGTNITFQIYQDGVWKNSHTANVGTNYINRLSFGTTTLWSGVHKGLSIYNRVLSTDEIEKVIKGTYSVTDTGVIARGVEQTSIGTKDCVNIPLGFDGSSEHGYVIPSQDVANYGTGDAYVYPGAPLEYNLNSYGLAWDQDWTIGYMKKPIGTYRGETDITGYSLESLGCNSNSVGGEYRWFGKANGSDKFSMSSQNGNTFTQGEYFGEWQYVFIRYSSGTITWTVYYSGKLSTVSQSYTPGAANAFVTQYGYDLKLGGWDNGNEGWAYYRNLFFVQRRMSDTEVENIFKTKMKANKYGIILQNGIETNAII